MASGQFAMLSQPPQDHLRGVFPSTSEEALCRLLERLKYPLIAVTAILHEAFLGLVVTATALGGAVVAVASTWDGAAL
jgi:hypothetical protein